LYVHKDEIIPYEGIPVTFEKHLPTLKFKYTFNMIVSYSGGSRKHIPLLDRNDFKISLNMENGSIILEFLRFPLALDVLPKNENVMIVKTRNILPFQKNIKLEIRHDLRFVAILINKTILHTEYLPFIPFISNNDGFLIPDGASKWVYISKFDFNPKASFKSELDIDF
tara:strand:+ start:686 stop:1189 length:504 start_codon:yes stop_codon:yes gene_type:complete